MSFGNTRAALLIETKDKDGNPQVLIYHLSEPIRLEMEQEYTSMYNIFDGHRAIRPFPTRLTVQAYLAGAGPQHWGGPMPDPEQAEIEPAQLAIESNEGEIVIDPDDYEDWQRDG